MHAISFALDAVLVLALVGGFFAWRGNLFSSGQLIAQINRFLEWAPGHGAQLRRYFAAAQAVTGAFLLIFGYAIGRDHLHLIRVGRSTYGIVVGYKQVSLPDNGLDHWDTASLPVVRYQAGDKTFQFRDWMDDGVEVKNIRVRVLYDPRNPSAAMIDRPVYNWIPWAPTMAVGVFLLLASVSSWFRSRSAKPWPSPGASQATLRYKWTNEGLKKDDGADLGS